MGTRAATQVVHLNAKVAGPGGDALCRKLVGRWLKRLPASNRNLQENLSVQIYEAETEWHSCGKNQAL